jgi:energy-coupling factor transport system permease protein
VRQIHAVPPALLQRLDPLSKLVVLFCIALLVMHWSHPMQALLTFIVLVVIALCWTGMNWRDLGRRMLFIIGFGVPLFILTLISTPTIGSYIYHVGPIKLPQEALFAAVIVTFRLFILYLSSLIYIQTTEPKDFVVIMTTTLKLPYRIMFGVSMALTFLPLLESEARNAREGRKIRSGRAPQGISEKITHWQGNVLSIFTGAIRRVQQTAGAMDAKGFGAFSKRSYLHEVQLSTKGYLVMSCSLILTVWLWLL